MLFRSPQIKTSAFSLAGLKGQRVVVFFFPKADTPGCTKEACEFRDASKTFTKQNAVIVGISPDKEAAHVKFATKYALPYTLVPDPDHAIAARQMSGFGGMVCFDLAGRFDRASACFDRLRLIARAASLGGVESLVSLPVLTSHTGFSDEQLREALEVALDGGLPLRVAAGHGIETTLRAQGVQPLRGGVQHGGRLAVVLGRALVQGPRQIGRAHV